MTQDGEHQGSHTVWCIHIEYVSSGQAAKLWCKCNKDLKLLVSHVLMSKSLLQVLGHSRDKMRLQQQREAAQGPNVKSSYAVSSSFHEN